MMLVRTASRMLPKNIRRTNRRTLILLRTNCSARSWTAHTVRCIVRSAHCSITISYEGVPLMRARLFGFLFAVSLIAGAVAFQPVSGTAQDVHNHTPAVSGVPQGVPLFCANPTVRSIGSGAWSDSKIWSTGKIPGANDKVRIEAGHV